MGLIIVCPDHEHNPATPAFGLEPYTIHAVPGQDPNTSFASRLEAGMVLFRSAPGDYVYIEAKHEGVITAAYPRQLIKGDQLRTWIRETIDHAQSDPISANRVICIRSQRLTKSKRRFTGQNAYGTIGRIALMIIPEQIREKVLRDVMPVMYRLEKAGIGSLFDYGLMEELRKRKLYTVDEWTWLRQENCGSRSNPPADWINRKPLLVKAIEVLEQNYAHSTSAVTTRGLLEGKCGCRKFGHKGWPKRDA